MHAERDWLRLHVFPVLEERLRERFHHLETVDLRWGVESASAQEEQDRELVVLTICLREIERSRPFLLGLLGDRYGWRPPSARITEAAREAGLDADVAGKSVTELEILFGVLCSADQTRRSWFYLRDPLPYDAMPPAVAARYSEAHAGEPEAADNAQKLRALKARLATALPGRVRTYSGRWDPETQSVRGLESWGAQVLEDLWADLQAETSAFLQEAPRTWQAQDRWALDEFIEGRVRGFVGRTGITNELIALATSPPADDAPWGACVTAPAGGGKSSLFGHLYRSLQQKNVLVLGHAAGISVRSTQVDWMLRRWVGELADSLGQANPLTEQAPPDEIDQTFSRLLHRAAQRRRVVILIDALNQFEPTTRATYVTWLPRLWPSNARLTATAIPGTQSGALLQRQRIFEKPLPPIDRSEALDIVRSICTRYHRTLNTRVETALLGKRQEAEAPAFGNPLWLELATEELNLLGAEAFDRSDTSGAQGIVNLLVSVVEQMPPDIEELYGWMLDRAEQHFGAAWTRAFVNTIAVSRGGWREADLEKLMPVLSGEPWDLLRFATLRRAFRAHIVQRGANAQWDFAHAQMRKSIEQRLADEGGTAAELHRAIANHLLLLPHEDLLHETETMVHLMQEGASERAAAYYGGKLSDREAQGATSVLASLVVSQGTSEVVSLLDQPMDNARRGRVGERFLFELSDALRHSAPLDVRGQVAQSAARAFSELTTTDPGNAGWQRNLSVSHERVGNVLATQGNLPVALTAFQATHRILERLTADDPDNAGWQRDLSVIHREIGDVLVAQGNLPGALAAYQDSLAICERVTTVNPDDSGWQRDLSVCSSEIGDVLAEQGNLPEALAAYRGTNRILERLAAADPSRADWQHDLSVSHERIGEVLTAQGNLRDALAAYQASLAIAERLAATDPGHAGWQRRLSVSHNKIGEVLMPQGNLPGALAAFQATHRILQRLSAADPGNTGNQRDLSVSYGRIGNVLTAQGNLPGAQAAFQASLAIDERLAATDLTNASWQRNLSMSHDHIGDFLTAQGNLPGALAAFQASLAIRERLAAGDPGNTSWQRDLSVSYQRIGNVLRARGNLQGALAALQATHRILEGLAAADPANAGWQRDLSVSHVWISDVLTAQGDLPGALVAVQASLAIVERLAAAETGNADWQHNLAVSRNKIGDVLMAQGNLPAALAAFQAAHRILEHLAATDSSNSGWQRDLSVSEGRIGDVLTAQGDLPGALAAFQATQRILQRLATADPGNTGWQRDLSFSHARIGDVLTAQGNLPGALAAVEASLAIDERLAATDPGNAGWQRNLVVSLYTLATQCDRVSDPASAEYWRRCHAVLQYMRANGMFLDPPLAQLLEQLDARSVV